jgi:hypothetical protein
VLSPLLQVDSITAEFAVPVWWAAAMVNQAQAATLQQGMSTNQNRFSRTSSRSSMQYSGSSGCSPAVAEGSSYKKKAATGRTTDFGALAKLAAEENSLGNKRIGMNFQPRMVTVSPKHKKAGRFNPASPGGASEADEEMLEAERPRCILEPDAPFKMSWDMSILILIVYNVFSVPVAICFSVRLRNKISRTHPRKRSPHLPALAQATEQH